MAGDSLGMSDEDFLKAPMPEGDVAEEQQAAEPTETVDEEEAGEEGEGAAEESTEADEPATDADPDAASDDQDEEPAEADEPGAGTAPGKSAEEGKETGTEDKPAAVKDDKAGKEEAKPATDEAKPETPAIDYKAEYEKLMAPFKANGKDFTAKSVEDAKALMSMGANYSKKMQALKPHLKLVKSLEKAGLLSEEKISYMIDLMSNAPGAVNKLVKEAGIDPMDLDADKAGEYQAGNHSVSDTEMDLDEVMNDLNDSPKLGELITLVTKELDHASKEEIRKSPAILRVLDSHMNNGVYDKIMAELNHEITLGRLKNVPMLTAYQQIGDRMNKEGAFNHLGKGSSQPQKETPPAGRIVEPPKSVKADEDKLNAKRRAASSNRPVVANTGKQSKDFDVLAMTDADFEKMGI